MGPARESLAGNREVSICNQNSKWHREWWSDGKGFGNRESKVVICHWGDHGTHHSRQCRQVGWSLPEWGPGAPEYLNSMKGTKGRERSHGIGLGPVLACMWGRQGRGGAWL